MVASLPPALGVTEKVGQDVGLEGFRENEKVVQAGLSAWMKVWRQDPRAHTQGQGDLCSGGRSLRGREACTQAPRQSSSSQPFLSLHFFRLPHLVLGEQLPCS